MLSDRFKYDDKPVIRLNKVQLKSRELIKQKLDDGIYKLRIVNCSICNSNNFKILSEKDRYGLLYTVVICSNCGLVQANPVIVEDSYAEFYKNEYWPLYLGKTKPGSKLFNSQYERANLIYRFLKPYLKRIPSATSVFELGCSTGGILKYFADRGFVVSGIDLNSECVNYGVNKHQLDLQVGDIHHYQPEKKAAIIICSHILEHSCDPVSDLQNISKILDDEGLLYIEVPGIKNLRNSYGMDFLKYLQQAHTLHFTKDTLINLLHLAGFEIIEADEFVRCIAIKGKEMSKMPIVSDYKPTLDFLTKLEEYRKKRGFNWKKIIVLPKQGLKVIMKITGIYKVFFKYYHLRK
jgi:SAM-dependent methyltransferase